MEVTVGQDSQMFRELRDYGTALFQLSPSGDRLVEDMAVTGKPKNASRLSFFPLFLLFVGDIFTTSHVTVAQTVRTGSASVLTLGPARTRR